MSEPLAFSENLAQLNDVVDRLPEDSDTRHFYHSLIVACAKRMKHGTFLQALHEAKEKMSQ
jgi:hypothetical protein